MSTKQTTAAPGRVLIVEDEKPLRDVYDIILKNAGYEVATATHGREALDAVIKRAPDFILLDIFMPVMGGVEFLRALQQRDRDEIAIVVFSNNSDSGVRDEVLSLGARDVILKADVSPSGLVELVGRYLQ